MPVNMKPRRPVSRRCMVTSQKAPGWQGSTQLNAVITVMRIGEACNGDIDRGGVLS